MPYFPSKAALRGLILASCLLATACSAASNGTTMHNEAGFDTAWQVVTGATAPGAQRTSIDAFLAMNRQAGAPPLMVTVTRRDTGEKAAIDKALWDNPQEYEVTLRYGDRRYGFTPLSRASLEPLFRE